MLMPLTLYKNKILPQCTAETVFIQETKFTGKRTREGDTDIDRARAALGKDGYRASFATALDTDKGGVSSGVGIAWRSDKTARCMPDIVPGLAVGALIQIGELGFVLCISVYGHVADPIVTRNAMVHDVAVSHNVTTHSS